MTLRLLDHGSSVARSRDGATVIAWVYPMALSRDRTVVMKETPASAADDSPAQPKLSFFWE